MDWSKSSEELKAERIDSTVPVPERLAAMECVLESYSNMLRQTIELHREQWWKKGHWAHQAGIGPKKARKMLRGASETRAFSSGSVRAYKRGGFAEMLAFDRQFKWRFQPKD